MPAPWKLLCIQDLTTDFSQPIVRRKVLDVENNRLALQNDAIFKRVTYILSGSNRNTLYIARLFKIKTGFFSGAFLNIICQTWL